VLVKRDELDQSSIISNENPHHSGPRPLGYELRTRGFRVFGWSQKWRSTAFGCLARLRHIAPILGGFAVFCSQICSKMSRLASRSAARRFWTSGFLRTPHCQCETGCADAYHVVQSVPIRPRRRTVSMPFCPERICG
jgi:hypothetical protein